MKGLKSQNFSTDLNLAIKLFSRIT